MKTGKLYVNSPYGRESFKVLVIRQFFGFYRIQALRLTRLAGQDRYLKPGERHGSPSMRYVCWKSRMVRPPG